jgi:hypothetical protein
VSTLYHCPKCNTRDHYATDVCPKDAGGGIQPVDTRGTPAHADPGPPVAAPIKQAQEFIKRVGRPRLNRSPEQKKEHRRKYMKLWRKLQKST